MPCANREHRCQKCDNPSRYVLGVRGHNSGNGVRVPPAPQRHEQRNANDAHHAGSSSREQEVVGVIDGHRSDTVASVRIRRHPSRAVGLRVRTGGERNAHGSVAGNDSNDSGHEPGDSDCEATVAPTKSAASTVLRRRQESDGIGSARLSTTPSIAPMRCTASTAAACSSSRRLPPRRRCRVGAPPPRTACAGHVAGYRELVNS